MRTPTRPSLPLQRIASLQDRHFLLTEFFGGEPVKPFSSHELVILFPNCSAIWWEGEPGFLLENLKIKVHALAKGGEMVVESVCEAPVLE